LGFVLWKYHDIICFKPWYPAVIISHNTPSHSLNAYTVTPAHRKINIRKSNILPLDFLVSHSWSLSSNSYSLRNISPHSVFMIEGHWNLYTRISVNSLCSGLHSWSSQVPCRMGKCVGLWNRHW
jgi:hypothetical protein